MADWIRTQGDQVHSLYSQLTDSVGNLDIPPGTTVALTGRLLGDTDASIGGNGVVIRAGAEVDDPNRGVVRYDLSTLDVSIAGLYYCKWRLVPPGSSQTQSFPEDGSLLLLIVPTV